MGIKIETAEDINNVTQYALFSRMFSNKDAIKPFETLLPQAGKVNNFFPDIIYTNEKSTDRPQTIEFVNYLKAKKYTQDFINISKIGRAHV